MIININIIITIIIALYVTKKETNQQQNQQNDDHCTTQSLTRPHSNLHHTHKRILIRSKYF